MSSLLFRAGRSRRSRAVTLLMVVPKLTAIPSRLPSGSLHQTISAYSGPKVGNTGVEPGTKASLPVDANYVVL